MPSTPCPTFSLPCPALPTVSLLDAHGPFCFACRGVVLADLRLQNAREVLGRRGSSGFPHNEGFADAGAKGQARAGRNRRVAAVGMVPSRLGLAETTFESAGREDDASASGAPDTVSPANTVLLSAQTPLAVNPPSSPTKGVGPARRNEDTAPEGAGRAHGDSARHLAVRFSAEFASNNESDPAEDRGLLSLGSTILGGGTGSVDAFLEEFHRGVDVDARGQPQSRGIVTDPGGGAVSESFRRGTPASSRSVASKAISPISLSVATDLSDLVDSNLPLPRKTDGPQRQPAGKLLPFGKSAHGEVDEGTSPSTSSAALEGGQMTPAAARARGNIDRVMSSLLNDMLPTKNGEQVKGRRVSAGDGMRPEKVAAESAAAAKGSPPAGGAEQRAAGAVVVAGPRPRSESEGTVVQDGVYLTPIEVLMHVPAGEGDADANPQNQSHRGAAVHPPRTAKVESPSLQAGAPAVPAGGVPVHRSDDGQGSQGGRNVRDSAQAQGKGRPESLSIAKRVVTPSAKVAIHRSTTAVIGTRAIDGAHFNCGEDRGGDSAATGPNTADDARRRVGNSAGAWSQEQSRGRLGDDEPSTAAGGVGDACPATGAGPRIRRGVARPREDGAQTVVTDAALRSATSATEAPGAAPPVRSSAEQDAENWAELGASGVRNGEIGDGLKEADEESLRRRNHAVLLRVIREQGERAKQVCGEKRITSYRASADDWMLGRPRATI